MPCRLRNRLYRPVLALACGALCGMGMLLGGCADKQPAPAHEEPRYPTLPLATVPSFMHDTMFERVRFTNTQPLPVFGYSLVVNLHNTGDSTASSVIRAYIARQIILRGFGNLQYDQFKDVSPEQMLADKRVAIVEVEGDIPVGAHEGDRMDVNVRAMPNGHTKSLAHGRLYQTDLSDHGLIDPNGIAARRMAGVHGGQVFVNPAYALSEGASTNPSAESSILHGVVLDGGVAGFDRPIQLELRQPQLSIAERMGDLIQRRWQDDSAGLRAAGMATGHGVAEVQDEGLINIYVPSTYHGDWKHFVGVVSHLYLNDSPAFIAPKARQLVALAHKPGAPLADISLCWEAMGQSGMNEFEPLITDPNPDIAFAAARAAAFCGDVAARAALLNIAANSGGKNQIDAVNALSELPKTGDTIHMLRSLLNSDMADVRIAAYRALVDIGDESGIVTKAIGDRFYLDQVESNGQPMVYATNTGVPRIAIFGHRMGLRTPITFAAMNYRFTISSADGTRALTMFYRDPQERRPINIVSDNNLSEIVMRLGGEGPPADDVMNLSFSDVVALLQQMVSQGYVYGSSLQGNQLAGVFQLQHPQLDSDAWTSIPKDNSTGRPQGTPKLPAATAPSARAGG